MDPRVKPEGDDGSDGDSNRPRRVLRTRYSRVPVSPRPSASSCHGLTVASREER